MEPCNFVNRRTGETVRCTLLGEQAFKSTLDETQIRFFVVEWFNVQTGCIVQRLLLKSAWKKIPFETKYSRIRKLHAEIERCYQN